MTAKRGCIPDTLVSFGTAGESGHTSSIFLIQSMIQLFIFLIRSVLISYSLIEKEVKGHDWQLSSIEFDATSNKEVFYNFLLLYW